jgi:hypothetical protein
MLSSAYEYVDIKNCFIDHFNFEKEIVGIVKAGKQKDIIDTVRILRSNNDPAYKQAKMNLMVITPFGSFAERVKEELIAFSGFIFLDIDSKDNPEIEDYEQTKREIFNEHRDKIFMICLSSSGKGLSIFIKIDRPFTDQEFCSVYSYIKGLIPGYVFDKGIGTDGDIARAWFVSYDPDPLYNNNAYVTVPLDIPHVIPIENKERRKHITLKRTLFNWDEILANNILRTKHVMVNPVIDVIPEEHIFIWWKKCITEGSRKKTLRIIGYKFLRLNPQTGEEYIYALFHNLNEVHIRPKLTGKEIQKTALTVLETYTEDMFIPSITKTKHYAPDKLYPKQKSKFSNELSGLLRKNKSILKIVAKCNELSDAGLKVNQSVVSRETGIRRGTVNKYWGLAPIDDEINQMIQWINITYSDRDVSYKSKILHLDHSNKEVQDKCNNKKKHITVKRTLSESIVTNLREVHNINIREIINRIEFNRQRAEKSRLTKEENKFKKLAEMRERLPCVLIMLNEKFGISPENTIRRQALAALNSTRDDSKSQDTNDGVLDSQNQDVTSNECTSESISNQVLNEPQNKPDWWQSLDYYESAYGEDGKEMYEGQFDMIEHLDPLFK